MAIDPIGASRSNERVVVGTGSLLEVRGDQRSTAITIPLGLGPAPLRKLSLAPAGSPVRKASSRDAPQRLPSELGTLEPLTVRSQPTTPLYPIAATKDPRQQRQLFNVPSSGATPRNDATVATDPIGHAHRPCGLWQQWDQWHHFSGLLRSRSIENVDPGPPNIRPSSYRNGAIVLSLCASTGEADWGSGDPRLNVLASGNGSNPDIGVPTPTRGSSSERPEARQGLPLEVLQLFAVALARAAHRRMDTFSEDPHARTPNPLDAAFRGASRVSQRRSMLLWGTQTDGAGLPSRDPAPRPPSASSPRERRLLLRNSSTAKRRLSCGRAAR